MNPFSWPGPQFIFAYLVLAAFAIAWVWMRWLACGRGRESVKSIGELTSDPYRIAFLRGGPAEVMRIAAFNLVDRGILSFENGALHVGRNDASDFLRRPLERAILAACARPATMKDLLADRGLLRHAGEYAIPLAERGLVSSGAELHSRQVLGFVLAGALLAVAAIKLAYALSHGRTNVAFLVFAALVACVPVIAISHARRTRAGNAALRNLRTLMKRAKAAIYKLRPGGETNEALLLASVHGIAVLPELTFPNAHAMFPRPSSGGDSGGSGGSDSSSCSSGSSCGGGGGCGGCGS